MYDGANILEEVDQTGTLLARYTTTQNVDEPLAETRSGVTSHYEQDGLGSVTSLTNAAGALANTYTYDSFGKLTASTGTLVNPIGYAGRDYDADTGLYYFRSRYYDPTTGRFINEDRLGLSTDDFDLYAYVGNDPVDWVDPWGYSRDTYVPDPSHHGGAHIDRYNPAGQNVGRYDPDGRPLKHKGKLSPPIPNSDADKFKKAADKLKRKPNESCNQPKKMESVQPDYCQPGERFDCLPRPGGSPWAPWLPVNPVIPTMPTVPVVAPELLPVPI